MTLADDLIDSVAELVREGVVYAEFDALRVAKLDCDKIEVTEVVLLENAD